MPTTKTNKVLEFLDNPSTRFSRLFSMLLVTLIYFSVINSATYERYPEFYAQFETIFEFINNFILLIFSIELFTRLIFTPNRFKYFTSFYGIIDILSVVPELIAMFIIPVDSAIWLRVFKLFRILRILKTIRMLKDFDGITGRLIPYAAVAIAYKGTMVIFEAQQWWPNTKDLTIVVAVVGFALAVLLGTKLNVVNNRIFQIEDALCRIVGSMRDMQNNKAIKEVMYNWSSQLEATLKHKKDGKHEAVNDMIIKTDYFESKLEEAGVGGPNTAGFHRDVAYLLHRAIAQVPESYERFLKTITFVYTLTVILVVPGLIGLVSTVLLVFVLGGMFFLIEDMDSPLSYEADSFIDVRLEPLEMYNKNSRSCNT